MIQFESYFSGSSGNLYTCTDGDTTLLIEIGVPFRQAQKALSFQTSSIAGALISHSHSDHCKGVKDAARHGIDCYLSADTIKEIGVSGHRIKEVNPLSVFRVGSFKILPFLLQHDVTNLGFLIESDDGGKLLYCTDTFYVKYRFKNVDIFAVECNYSKEILDQNVKDGIVSKALRNRVIKSHFSLDRVKEFFRANLHPKIKEIHLIHLSGSNSDPDQFKSEIQAVTGCPVYVHFPGNLTSPGCGTSSQKRAAVGDQNDPGRPPLSTPAGFAKGCGPGSQNSTEKRGAQCHASEQ